MAEKFYKCGYTHCLHLNEKVSLTDSVLVGNRKYHKDCAILHEKIEKIKRIYFDYIDDKSDYVQVVGVINNLIFNKQYDADYVEFTLKYAAVFCRRYIKSPYVLHSTIKNGIVEKKYKDEQLRKDVIDRFEYRCRKK